MSQSMRKAAHAYTPIYFLGSLSAGGLSVTFFMYLLFWVPHKGRPVPVFEDIMAAFSSGDIAVKALIIAAMAGIAIMTAINIKSLLWNFSAFSEFKKPTYIPT